MHPHSVLLPFLLLLCSLTPSHASAPGRFLKSAPSSPNASTKYFEVTHTLPTDYQKPTYSLTLLQYDFNNTVGSPAVEVDYSPPTNCSCEWIAVVLEFSASCRGRQYNRIAAVWIDGVEILRTSTAEPTENGVFWTVKKDVTRYASVLQRSNSTVSVMLQNEVNDVLTGVYNVNLSLYFYGGQEIGVSSVEVMEKEEEGNRFKMSRKLGFLAEYDKEGDRKVGSLGEEGAERDGKSAFSSKENSQLGFLGLPSEDLGMMDKRVKSNPLYEKPADLIIPISDEEYGEYGFWYEIKSESDTHSTEIEIPVNTYRAVLEIYVSSHSNDEFWYSNPPNTFLLQNNGTSEQGKGAFRQVFATVDELYVGSVVPFPVVYTGGINRMFWEPVVAIGAFDLPSYDLDITPFLGHLLDGKIHSFSLGVSDAMSFWLVDANLHLWLDPGSSQVEAKLVQYRAPELSISRKSKFGVSEEKFKIKAEKETNFAGWVNSSFGNLTTYVLNELEFENEIEIKNNGNSKEVEQKIKTKTEIRVEAYSKLLARAIYETEYPLKIKNTTEHKVNNIYMSRIKFTHEMKEKSSVTLPSRQFSSTLDNSQESNGWILVQNHSVLSGVGSTLQKYKYRDGKVCYVRTVASNEGELMEDNFTNVCLEALE